MRDTKLNPLCFLASSFIDGPSNHSSDSPSRPRSRHCGRLLDQPAGHSSCSTAQVARRAVMPHTALDNDAQTLSRHIKQTRTAGRAAKCVSVRPWAVRTALRTRIEQL